MGWRFVDGYLWLVNRGSAVLVVKAYRWISVVDKWASHESRVKVCRWLSAVDKQVVSGIGDAG